jgi:hypothetical protein
MYARKASAIPTRAAAAQKERSVPASSPQSFSWLPADERPAHAKNRHSKNMVLNGLGI